MENMKPGDYVRFEYQDTKQYAYGRVVWSDGDNINVDYKNPVSCEHEVKPIEKSKLTKIGSK